MIYSNMIVLRSIGVISSSDTLIPISPQQIAEITDISFPFPVVVHSASTEELMAVTGVDDSGIHVTRSNSPSDFPSGALIVAGLDTSMMSNVVYPGPSRVVTQCPNYFVTPLFLGEIIYQTGGLPCQKKVWIAVHPTQARWQLIGGYSCTSAEDYQEQGWKWQGAPVNPTTSALMHYTFEDLSGGTGLDTLVDHSGNGYNMPAWNGYSTSGLTWNSIGSNGHSCVSPDNLAPWQLSWLVSNFVPNTTGYGCIVVGRVIGSIAIAISIGLGNFNFLIGVHPSGGGKFVFGHTGGGGKSDIHQNYRQPGWSGDFIVSAKINTSFADNFIRYNGKTPSTKESSNASALGEVDTTSGSASIQVGAYFPSSYTALSEIYIFDSTATSSQIQSYESTMASKYGITLG